MKPAIYYNRAHWEKLWCDTSAYILVYENQYADKVISRDRLNKITASAFETLERCEVMLKKLVWYPDGRPLGMWPGEWKKIKDNQPTVINGINFTVMLDDAKEDLHDFIDRRRKEIEAQVEGDKVVERCLNILREVMKMTSPFMYPPGPPPTLKASLLRDSLLWPVWVDLKPMQKAVKKTSDAFDAFAYAAHGLKMDHGFIDEALIKNAGVDLARPDPDEDEDDLYEAVYQFRKRNGYYDTRWQKFLKWLRGLVS